MSIEATAWALSLTGLQDATERAILLGLANHATRDGSAAWPSVSTLAEYAVCSTRTVQRRLRDLEARGLVCKGDQRLVAHLPADRRPFVYDLPLGVTHSHPAPSERVNGVTPVTRRGDTAVTQRGDIAVSPKPSMNHPEPSTPPNPPEGGGEQGELLAPEPPKRADYPDGFEDAWAAWPKRRTDSAGKKAAHTAWHRAVVGTAKRKPRTTAGAILDAVRAYAADPNLPPEQYMPNMTTWLNGDRWENGPLPPRSGTGNRPQAGDTDRAMRRSLTASQRYRQLEESGYQPPQNTQAPQGPRMITRRTA